MEVDPRQALLSCAGNPHGDIAEGALWIAADDCPGVEPEPWLERIDELAGELRTRCGLRECGPADAPLSLVRGRRRKRFLVRAERSVDLQGFLAAWRARVRAPSSVRVTVDVDPYSFL